MVTDEYICNSGSVTETPPNIVNPKNFRACAEQSYILLVDKDEEQEWGKSQPFHQSILMIRNDPPTGFVNNNYTIIEQMKVKQRDSSTYSSKFFGNEFTIGTKNFMTHLYCGNDEEMEYTLMTEGG